MNLLSLFFKRPPVSHTNDPLPSHIAEGKINASGQRESNSQRVLRTVKTRPHWTAPELASRCGLGETETRRRLSDLKNRGLVRSHNPRLCAIKGTTMSVWEAIQ